MHPSPDQLPEPTAVLLGLGRGPLGLLVVQLLDQRLVVFGQLQMSETMAFSAQQTNLVLFFGQYAFKNIALHESWLLHAH